MGGLGFLLLTQEQFAILAAALSSVIAGQFANEILHFGDALGEIRVPTGVFISASVVIIFLPLTPFSPRLFETRRVGLSRYSRGQRRRRQVRSQVDSKGRPPAGINGRHSGSLFSYRLHDVIREMHVIPIRKRAVVYVTGFAAAPFGFVWLLASPVEKAIAEILKRLL
jgi:hypothetical protein